MLDPAHVERLVTLVGGVLFDVRTAQEAAQFIYDPAPAEGSPQYEKHLRNYRAIGEFIAGESCLTLYPRSTQEVAAVIAFCNAHGVRVFAQGGNSGLVGASVPDPSGAGIVLSTRKMDRILSTITPTSSSVKAEAGVVIDALNAEAAQHGLFCSIKHGGTGSATAGGSVATNSGGANAVRYGVTRDQVIGLEVVTTAGDILQLGGTLKDTSSLVDLKHTVIGSAGTLALITQVEFKLHPIPRTRELALIGLDGFAEVDAVLAKFRRVFCNRIEAFEFMDGRIFELSVGITQGAGSLLPEMAGRSTILLVEVTSGKDNDAAVQEDLFTALADHGSVLMAMDAGQRELFWRVREHCNPASKQHCGDRGVYFDNCVPVSQMTRSMAGTKQIMNDLFPQEMEQGVIEVLDFGHCADGNIHTHVVQPLEHQAGAFDLREHAHAIEEAILRFNVLELGGNPAAEHNIGVKTSRLAFADPAQQELVSRIKKVFDPNGIMNPGRGSVKAGE